jgi:hypothetical protein
LLKFYAGQAFKGRAEPTSLSTFLQFCQKILIMIFLARPVWFSMTDYGLQVGQRLIKVIVDNQAVELTRM